MKQVSGSTGVAPAGASSAAPGRAVLAASLNSAESALSGASSLKQFVLPAPRITGGMPLIFVTFAKTVGDVHGVDAGN